VGNSLKRARDGLSKHYGNCNIKMCIAFGIESASATCSPTEFDGNGVIQMPIYKQAQYSSESEEEENADKIGSRWVVLFAGCSGYGNYRHHVFSLKTYVYVYYCNFLQNFLVYLFCLSFIFLTSLKTSWSIYWVYRISVRKWKMKFYQKLLKRAFPPKLGLNSLFLRFLGRQMPGLKKLMKKSLTLIKKSLI